MNRLLLFFALAILGTLYFEPISNYFSPSQPKAVVTAEKNVAKDVTQFAADKQYYFKGDAELRDLTSYELENQALVQDLLSRGKILEKASNQAVRIPAQESSAPAGSFFGDAKAAQRLKEQQEAMKAVNAELDRR